MKTKAIIIIVIVASILSGCTVLSFYPLYTEDVLIRDDRITGTWISVNSGSLFGDPYSDTLLWEISFPAEIEEMQSHIQSDSDNKIPNTFTYILEVFEPSDPENQARFSIHLVKLGNQVFIDFFPVDWEGNSNNTFLTIHLMGVHTFAKADIGTHLQINWFDADYLEDLLKENRIRVTHENNGNYTLLTAKPAELQKFVLKYANEDEALSESLNYQLSRYNPK